LYGASAKHSPNYRPTAVAVTDRPFSEVQEMQGNIWRINELSSPMLCYWWRDVVRFISSFMDASCNIIRLGKTLLRNLDQPQCRPATQTVCENRMAKSEKTDQSVDQTAHRKDGLLPARIWHLVPRSVALPLCNTKLATAIVEIVSVY